MLHINTARQCSRVTDPMSAFVGVESAKLGDLQDFVNCWRSVTDPVKGMQPWTSTKA
jgi:hypothetical protein